jgi:ammonium transporter, Amt family
MDVFAEHGVAGMIGLLFNAFFAADYIIGLDGVNAGIINGGWLNHNYKQLYIQAAYIVAAAGYAFVMSAILALIVNFIPGLHLRASEEAELLGMDDDQLGEFAYDYVEVRRDYLAWTPAKDEPEKTESNISPSDRHGILQHSEMINGQSPNGENGHVNGNNHTGIMGDRHGIAAEDEIKEKQGLPGANGNDA